MNEAAEIKYEKKYDDLNIDCNVCDILCALGSLLNMFVFFCRRTLDVFQPNVRVVQRISASFSVQ